MHQCYHAYIGIHNDIPVIKTLTNNLLKVKTNTNMTGQNHENKITDGQNKH